MKSLVFKDLLFFFARVFYFVMVTNQVMVRQLGSFEVLQRTKDGFFDGNALLSQWNKENTRRRLDDFLKNSNTIEFINALQEDLLENTPRRNISNGVNQVVSTINEISIESQIQNFGYGNFQVVKLKKGRNTSKGKTKDEVWMHPYLFVKFAMWINPRFEVKVIQFVYDELIKNRHDAGDNYKQLINSVVKLQNCDIPQTAKAMQWIVFGKTGKNLRNGATKEQLQELSDLQNKLSFAIDMNFIKSFEQLMIEMRKMYKTKHNNLFVS